MKTNALLLALFISHFNLQAETSLVGFKKDTLVMEPKKGETSLLGFRKEEFSKKNNSIPFYVQGADKGIDYKLGGFHNEDFVGETINELQRNASTGCEQKATGPYVDGFDRNVTLLNAPFIKLNCDSVEALKNQKQLTPDICLGLAGCLKSKVDFRSSEAAVLFRKAREQAARESIALTAKAGISQMIDFESLRRYAEMKYGKDFIPESCSDVNILRTPAPDEEGRAGCHFNLIDEGYELAQNICRVPESGCNFEYLDYIKNKKRENLSSPSYLSSFIEDTSNKKAQEGLSQDTRLLQTISMLLADSSMTAEKRVESAMSYIYSNFSKMDPILKSYYDRSISTRIINQKDPIAEGLLSYIKLNEHKSSVDILVDLENLRKSEAKSLLEKKCHKVNTIAGFCGAVQDIIAGGAELMVDKRDFDKMLSRKPEITDAIMTRENMAYNVARCNTFNLFETHNGIVSKSEVRLSLDLDLFSDNSGSSFRSDYLGNVQNRVKKPTLVIDPNGLLSKSDKSISSFVSSKLVENKEKDKGTDLLLVRNFSKNAAMPEVYAKDDAKPLKLTSGLKRDEDSAISASSTSSITANSLASSFSMAQKDTMMMGATKTPVQSSGPVITNDAPIIQNISSEVEVSREESSGKKQYNQMVDKIAGLEERLGKAQKKTSDGVSSSEDTKVSSAPSESESDLIKELKNARNTLVEMNKKKDISQATTTAVSEKAVVVNSKARAGEDLYVSEESQREASRDSRENGSGSASGRNSRSVASHDSGERFDGGEGHKFSSASRSPANEENAYIERGESIVLTKVDGVSNTKMNQTIKDLIYAESGKPFYIEENGMVKQIIPEIVDGQIMLNEDGTPLYKTVVKGKVGEFKVDLKEKKEKNDKKVAKQKSAADVKKADEKSGPVVRYRDLKDVLRLTTETQKSN